MRQEIATAIGLHLYQPPHRSFHRELASCHTDPMKVDWTKVILSESYRPLALNGSLDKASFDVYGILRQEIGKIDEAVYKKIREQLKNNGVGDSYLHPILPDLFDVDKKILITAGQKSFTLETGVVPLVFWAPESALDFATLNVLAEADYQAFICAPEQIRRADGQPSDNKPTRIRLSRGRSILALPFDRPLSSQLAFGNKENAEKFVDQNVLPAAARTQTNNFLLAWTDGETFGHHDKGGERFLHYLLFEVLESKGFVPVSVNTMLAFARNISDGFLIERSSWSCPHGDLTRWHGKCGCHGGDSSWKGPFYSALHKLNGEITTLISERLPEYTECLSSAFKLALENQGAPESTPEKSLLSAKASALAAITSCGTYFEDPHTSGNINVLFALQACLHLEEAGFEKEARFMLSGFKQTLMRMPSWTYLGHKGTVIGDFINQ